MGVVVSLFSNSTGRTDDPDPTTGLTSRERYLVMNSWNAVRKNSTQNGVKLLILYFKKYPSYQQLFPFRNTPLNELESSKKFQSHCNAVIYGVSSFIDKLNEPELLLTILSRVGETHVPRKVPDQAYWDLKETMLELFGTFMSEDELNAWKKTIDVAFNVIIQGAKEARETK